MMDPWLLLAEILGLLGVALVLGAVAERLRQSAIIGYLLAGTVLGPVLFSQELVRGIAELGVALLLFSIGLEFSWKRLRSLGRSAVIGGTAQILFTLALFAFGAMLFLPVRESVAIGAMVALSSTAVVLRVLMERAELESVRGRTALSILLVQDIAVVPLVILVTTLGEGGSALHIAGVLGKTVAAALVLIVVFYLIFARLVPQFLLIRSVSRNRELVILAATVCALGAAWAAHSLGLSAALGAFIAGLLLGDSEYATQIRADVAPLRTLFVTLFFTSIGMLAQPAWVLGHLPEVLTGLVLVLIGKTLVVYFIARFLKQNHYNALASGVTLAQIGEFSFVLATTALVAGAISPDSFALVVSVTILSLFVAPYGVSGATPLAGWVVRKAFPRYEAAPSMMKTDGPVCMSFVIGFGPAGRRVAEGLLASGQQPVVIEQNPKSARKAVRLGLEVHVGNARQAEVLAHAGIGSGCHIAVTVPDSATAREIVSTVKSMAPDAFVIVRARYHRYRWELEQAGADLVVDEEDEVGRILSARLAKEFSGAGNADTTIGIEEET